MADFQQLQFLKTSSVRSESTAARTSELSSKKCAELKTVVPQFLDLRKGAVKALGQTQEAFWQTGIPSLGESSTLNFGAYPNGVEESFLSQILQVRVPKKYYLSPTACRGVLRRAAKRGKELPAILKEALERQARGASKNSPKNEGEQTIEDELPLVIENHAQDSRVKICEDGKVPTLNQQMGTGGNNVPLVMKLRAGCEGGGKGALIKENKSLTLSTLNDQTLFEPVPFCKSARAQTSDDATTWKEGKVANCLNTFDIGETRCNELIVGVDVYNKTTTGDKARTLVAGHQDADGVPCVLALDRASYNQGKNAQYKISIDEDIAQTVVAKGPGAVCLIQPSSGEIAGTLDAHYYLGCGNRGGNEREIIAHLLDGELYVRRLTPTECGRLQGMPDWWCSDVEHSDAAEYKMWGNGMALPNILYVVENVVRVLKGEK